MQFTCVSIMFVYRNGIFFYLVYCKEDWLVTIHVAFSLTIVGEEGESPGAFILLGELMLP